MRHDRPRWIRVARVRARRFLSRLDRSAPLWLVWLPSWGVSLLVHGIILVILATMVYVSNQAPREKVDFDSTIVSLADRDFLSVVPADQSGDPMTEIQTDRAPSISLNPSNSGVSQPSMVASLNISRRMSAPDLSNSGRIPGLASVVAPPRVHVEDMTAPFSGRSGPNKAMLILREGGTTASEMAVQNGLAFLMRHQRKDGGWSLDVRGECTIGDGCPADVHVESDTAATGLGLLPFLGAGYIHTKPDRYQDVVQRGLDWLISHQDKSGMLFIGGGGNSLFYSHAIATMALCEAYGISKDPRLAEPAQRAIDFIIQTQNKDDGGWRYSIGQEGDTSVFGWIMFALRSARLAGLNVPISVSKRCVHYLDSSSCDKYRTTYSYLPGRGIPKPSMTAVGLLCRQYLGWTRENTHLQTGVAGVWKDLQFSTERDIYYWYYATQLLHNMHNKAWKQWNPKVRDGLVATQMTTKACDNGSWSPIEPQQDVWGNRGGRLYQTSLSILTLEVYYRFLPLYRTDEPVSPEEPSPKL